MKIFFAGDHAGFELKKELLEFVHSLGHEAEDLGPFAYDASDDYTDFVVPLARRVAVDLETRGIVVAGSGQGEVIAMNRVKGARAVEFYGGNLEVIKKTREHNNANILSIGARFATKDEAKEAIRVFLETPFSGDERHTRRLAKIDAL